MANMQQQFENLTASSLYCDKCKTAMPVRERLLLVLPDKEIFPISGVSRQGVDPLLDKLWRILEAEKSGDLVQAPWLAVGPGNAP